MNAPTQENVPVDDESSTPLWKQLWPLYVLVVGIGVVWANGWHQQLSLDTLRTQRETLGAFVQENFLLAVAAYLAAYIFATAFMLPGALWITIAGGFLFGLAGGSVATVVGATTGASLLFVAAQSSIGAALQQRAGPFLKKMERGFQDNALSYMFALRFLPVVPFPVANIAPALLGARFGQFVLTTFLGIIPGVVAYTWIGAGLGATFDAGKDPDLGSIASNLGPAVLALAVVSLLPVAWKKFVPHDVLRVHVLHMVHHSHHRLNALPRCKRVRSATHRIEAIDVV